MQTELKIIITGATGMIGRGVLMACLEHESVSKVLSISRRSAGVEHAKLEEIIHEDFSDFSKLKSKVGEYNACFFCLGVSSMGLSETTYRQLTVGIPLALAQVFVKSSNEAVFCHVSGMGANRESRGMWQRVKAEAEDRLLELPFKAAYIFRPGMVELLGGAKPARLSYKILYAVFGPLFPIFRKFPSLMTTNTKIGLAMIKVVQEGYHQPILESREINAVVRS